MSNKFKCKKNIKKLNNNLKFRHLSMISIGGSIGSGFFLALGTCISKSGPGWTLFSYLLIGLIVYFVMSSLSELSSFHSENNSFSNYGSSYVDEGFGFALGWNYWYNWAITIAVDLVGSQLVMEYWFPNVKGWIFSLSFLFVILLLNFLSVKIFGEIEYFFSLIKIFSIIIFIILSMLILFDFININRPVGFCNWFIGNAPFIGGFKSFLNTAIIAGFSFQGIEIINVFSGESEDKKKNISDTMKKISIRILFFYIFTIFLITLLIPYNNVFLNGVNSKYINPFTLILNDIGLKYAGSIINFIIFLSIFSAGNSGMYAATRMLYCLSKENKAPKIFSKLSKNGIPYFSLIITALVSSLCFISSITNPKTIYLWLLNTSGITGFIAWIGISISHYRFRTGYIKQGYSLNNLKYVDKFFPFGIIISIVSCLMFIFLENYYLFMKKKINWFRIFVSYSGIPLFLIIWLYYKFKKNTKFVSYDEMNFSKNKKN